MLDNGKGLARINVFRHKHEILCGKTSSISHQILGFDENGEVTNYGDIEKPSWAQIVHRSSKIINFYDMGGSAQHFKKATTSALSSDYLDYLLLVISAKEGITKRTENYLNYAYNMNLPIIAVITKIDLINDNEKQNLIKTFKSTVLKLKINRIPVILKNNDDIVLFSRNISEKNLMLTFLVSNLHWKDLSLFKSFLSMLSVNNKLENELKQIEMEKMEFDIHETIFKEQQYILIGIVNKGKIKANSKCFLGPDDKGNFRVVEIVNIHCKKINVAYANKGQYCSICIKSVNGFNKEDVRKGNVLLDIRTHPIASTLFEVELWTIDGLRRNVKYSYQPVLNIKHIRQGVRIKKEGVGGFCELKGEEWLEGVIMKKDVTLDNVKEEVEEMKKIYGGSLSSNSNSNSNVEEFVISSNTKTKVMFEFMYYPEYINVGSNVIISDQYIKAFGVITKIIK